MQKIIVTGSRTFDNYTLLRQTMIQIFKNVLPSEMEIISGHCPTGADRLAEQFAYRNNIKLTLFPAYWDKYGKSAGSIRNRQMAQYAMPNGYCVVFWDGKSKGSKNMIDEARRVGLNTKIVKYNTYK